MRVTRVTTLYVHGRLENDYRKLSVLTSYDTDGDAMEVPLDTASVVDGWAIEISRLELRMACISGVDDW